MFLTPTSIEGGMLSIISMFVLRSPITRVLWDFIAQECNKTLARTVPLFRQNAAPVATPLDSPPDSPVHLPDSPLHPLQGIAPATPEALVDDDSDDNIEDLPSTPLVFQASTCHGAPPTPEEFPDQDELCDLVKRGRILNVQTDRIIRIGKDTYNKLYLKNYEIDFRNGTITPPDKKKQ